MQSRYLLFLVINYFSNSTGVIRGHYRFLSRESKSKFRAYSCFTCLNTLMMLSTIWVLLTFLIHPLKYDRFPLQADSPQGYGMATEVLGFISRHENIHRKGNNLLLITFHHI